MEGGQRKRRIVDASSLSAVVILLVVDLIAGVKSAIGVDSSGRWFICIYGWSDYGCRVFRMRAMEENDNDDGDAAGREDLNVGKGMLMDGRMMEECLIEK